MKDGGVRAKMEEGRVMEVDSEGKCAGEDGEKK